MISGVSYRTKDLRTRHTCRRYVVWLVNTISKARSAAAATRRAEKLSTGRVETVCSSTRPSSMRRLTCGRPQQYQPHVCWQSQDEACKHLTGCMLSASNSLAGSAASVTSASRCSAYFVLPVCTPCFINMYISRVNYAHSGPVTQVGRCHSCKTGQRMFLESGRANRAWQCKHLACQRVELCVAREHLHRPALPLCGKDQLRQQPASTCFLFSNAA